MAVGWTWAFDTPDGTDARANPTGSGLIGDPATSLIAMRLPGYVGAGPTDTLQIIAPPTATRAEVVRSGSVVASTPLHLGIGSVSVALPASVTVRAYDASGKLVAEHVFVDDESGTTDQFEPEYDGW